MSEVDLDAVDASWDDDEPEEDEDVDALDAGWDQPGRRWKTAEEKSAARKEKARVREARQRERAQATASKQKKKQRKSRLSLTPARDPSLETDGADGSIRRESPAPRTHGWGRVLVAIAVVIAIAAIVVYVAK